MKIDPSEAGSLYASGLSIDAVAKHMGVAVMTAYRAILASGKVIRSKSAEVDEALVVSLYDGGLSLEDVGLRIGYGSEVVRRVLKKHGVQPRRSGAWRTGKSKFDAPRIAELHKSGMKVSQICAEVGCKPTQARRILSSLGLKAHGVTFYKEKYGTTSKEVRGYMWIRVKVGRWRREHCVIAESVLGRKLKKGECVHHIDGNGLNNANSNLMICTTGYHSWLHHEMKRRGVHEL